jgi:hypothetical protein
MTAILHYVGEALSCLTFWGSGRRFDLDDEFPVCWQSMLVAERENRAFNQHDLQAAARVSINPELPVNIFRFLHGKCIATRMPNINVLK